MTNGNLSVLIVSSATTLGQATSDLELENVLTACGVQTSRIVPNFFRLHRHLIRRPFNDLSQAVALSLAVRREVRRQRPDVVIYATTTATLFEPKHRLRSSALRFDALFCENRPGARNVGQRLLERRAMRYLPMLMPWSSATGLPRERYFTPARIVLPFPPPAATPVAAPVTVGPADVLCYGAGPKKKGLDIMVSAWSMARRPPGAKLLVTGIPAQVARSFLSDAGVAVPDTVEFLGKIPREQFGSYLAGVNFYLCGGRYEDFGMAQLEALAAGTVLVTSAAGGPYEAREIVQAVDERLVTPAGSAEALAGALSTALEFTPAQREEYANRARTLLSPYLIDTFQQRCDQTLIPRLRQIAGQPVEAAVAGS